MRKQESDLLNYIAEHADAFENGKVPSLEMLSQQLHISTGKLREQLEVARAIGIVEVRPKTGIRLNEYSFGPAATFSLLYGLSRDHSLFQHFSELRNHIEFSFFHEAVSQLTEADHLCLQQLIQRAWHKLDQDPPRIPHEEHRELHLTLFRRLNNLFVTGLLEAYWNAYEAEGLNVVYSDFDYLHEVWGYHDRIVKAVVAGDQDVAYQLLVQHTQLIQQHPRKRMQTQTQTEVHSSPAP
jgi:DNA-binding FadR family transcriptional regulator